MVDCGVAASLEEDMYGVDLVIPDFTYLVKNQGKPSFFTTHGPRTTWPYASGALVHVTPMTGRPHSA